MTVALIARMSGMVVALAGTTAAARTHPSVVREPVTAQDDRSTIRSDEEVVLFPTFAVQPEEGAAAEWRIPVRGWIYEPEPDDFLRSRMLARLRDAIGPVTDSEERVLLERRLRWFLVDNERGKRVAVRLAGETPVSEESSDAGQFGLQLSLAPQQVATRARDGWLPCAVDLPADDGRSFAGHVALLPRAGRTVICDVDDTVKISEVTDKQALLRNTFLRPFEAVPGMPELLARWVEGGAHLHFLSASPHALYPELKGFFDSAGIPPFTITMKHVRLKDSSVLDLLQDATEYKTPALRDLARRMPGRRLVLVGDSGEKDPEVYGALARELPEQVQAIYIRNVTGEGPDSARWSEAFRDVPRERWLLFEDGHDLARQLDGR